MLGKVNTWNESRSSTSLPVLFLSYVTLKKLNFLTNVAHQEGGAKIYQFTRTERVVGGD